MNLFVLSGKVNSPGTGLPKLRSKSAVSPGSKFTLTSKTTPSPVTKTTVNLRSKVSPGSRGSVVSKLEEKRVQAEKEKGNLLERKLILIILTVLILSWFYAPCMTWVWAFSIAAFLTKFHVW